MPMHVIVKYVRTWLSPSSPHFARFYAIFLREIKYKHNNSYTLDIHKDGRKKLKNKKR